MLLLFDGFGLESDGKLKSPGTAAANTDDLYADIP